MSKTQLRVKRTHPDAILPKYQSAGAACFDLHAVDVLSMTPEEAELMEKFGHDNALNLERPQVFRTGLAFEIPPGWVLKIYSRSGHGFKNDTRLANSVGVIDSDYRGEVMVKLTCDSARGAHVSVKSGDRIAQAMLEPAPQVEILEVDELSTTERGTGGFGSTGK